MAEKLDPKELVTLQDLAVSSAYEVAALVAVLQRKGILTEQEVIDEVKRMKPKPRRVEPR